MSGRFELFRLTLLAKQQASLFGPDLSREQFLRAVFGRPYKFKHYKTEFHYLPELDLSPPDAIIGRIGRSSLVQENLPPEEGFAEVSRPSWQAAVIVVDPRDHKDGQKLSFEDSAQVGAPSAVIASLVKAINLSHPDSQFILNASPIIAAESFWDFVREHPQQITRLTFDFVAPNGLWSASGNLKTELRTAREKLGAQRIINTFESDEGLRIEDEAVEEAVDYAIGGSGRIRATAMNGARYSSRTAPRTARLPPGEEREPTIVRVARHISVILGRLGQ